MSKQVAKQVVVSGYYGFDNYGDELILRCISGYLAQWGYQPVILSQDPEQTEIFLKDLNAIAIPRMNVFSIWKAIANAQIFISGGGGLFQDQSSWKSPFYYSILISLANHLGKPVAIFAQGMGPLSTWLGKQFTWNALLKSQIIIVRDEHALALAKFIQQQRFLFHNSKVSVPQLMADIAWLAPLPDEEPDSRRHGICISLRPCALLSTMMGWQALITLLLPELEKKLEEPIYLIAAQPIEDLPILEHFHALLPQQIAQRCKVIQGADKINACLMKASNVVGMRYHVLLMALRMQTPCFAIAYDPKVISLSQQSSLDYWDLVTEQPPPNTVTFKQVEPHKLQANQAAANTGLEALKNWMSKY